MNNGNAAYFIYKIIDDALEIGDLYKKANRARKPENQLNLFKDCYVRASALIDHCQAFELLLRTVPNIQQEAYDELVSYQDILTRLKDLSMKNIRAIEKYL